MEEHVQNIVVGAGIAGLICGGYLAKHGQSTLILEKNQDIGGRVKVYKFDGYTAIIHGPTWHATWDGGFWPSAARELGANVRFLIAKEPKIYRKGSHEPPVILPKCYTASSLVDYVESQFPEPFPTGLRQEFLSIFDEILRIPYQALCVDMDTVRLRDWIEARSSNPLVHAFFASMGANLMMMDAEKAWEILSSGKVFAIIRMWLVGEGLITFIVPETVEGLVQPFADAVHSFGGQIRTGHQVTEVIVEGGSAVGVRVREDGGAEKRLSADRVIVNCLYKDIPKLFKKMPPEVEEPVRNLEEAWLVDFWTFTGLGERITEDPSYIIVQDPETGSNLGGAIPQSLDQPWTAPAGKQLIWMEKIYSREEVKKRKKEDIYAEMNDIQEEIYPGFKRLTEVQKYASHQPLWHHQYTAFPKIPQKASSVDNLYFIGDGTAPQYGQGLDGPSSTGILCAKRILGIEA